MQGKKLEHHYFEIKEIKKSFFDKNDIYDFFYDWQILSLKEDTMSRYTKPKTIWKGAVRKGDK